MLACTRRAKRPMRKAMRRRRIVFIRARRFATWSLDCISITISRNRIFKVPESRSPRADGRVTSGPAYALPNGGRPDREDPRVLRRLSTDLNYAFERHSLISLRVRENHVCINSTLMDTFYPPSQRSLEATWTKDSYQDYSRTHV